MSRVACLLVTCCLEQSRAEILGEVLKNLGEQAPELREALTVFDNASTIPGTIDVLRDCYTHVHQASRNVGYWSAIDWWLESLRDDPPQFTYIIESDMIHYDFQKLWVAAEYLNTHPPVGSVRLHQYSVANRHLFNKDAPRPDSKRNLWQSHTNKVTGQPIGFTQANSDIWVTNFLTQLPALNRYAAMYDIFEELRAMGKFSELDFQRLYWQRYQQTGILDGGIFHCDLNPYTAKSLTGSWSSPEELAKIGYQATRLASITPRDQYTVS